MTTVRPPVAYTVAAIAGAAGWLGIAYLTNRREAWDSDLYFTWFLPSVALVLGALGFFAPSRPWRWSAAAFGAQAVAAFVQNPSANLLPMGLIVFAVYAAICSVPAYIGATIRRRVEPKADVAAEPNR